MNRLHVIGIGAVGTVRRIFHTLGVLAGVMALVHADGVAQSPLSPAPSGRVRLDGLLAAYERHEYAALDAALADLKGRPSDAVTFVREVRGQLGQWPARTGAAVALEAAGALLREAPTDVDDLLEAASRRVQRLGGDEGFRLAWYHAAVCVYQARPYALIGSDLRVDNELGNRPLETFLKLARADYPADRVLAMAWAVLHEQRLYLEFWGNAVPSTLGVQPRPGSHVGPPSARQLSDAAARFDALRADPTLAAEATLRLGLVLYQQQAVARALILWTELDQPESPSWLRYLARLFSGHALAAGDRPAEARLRYREALALFPGAQAAGVPLASLDFLAGDADAAAALAERLLRGDTPEDPWLSYFFRDWEVLADRVAALRKALP